MFIHYLNGQMVELERFYKWNETDLKILNWDLWSVGITHSHKPNNVSVNIETKRTKLSLVQCK